MTHFKPGDICIVIPSECLPPEKRAAFAGRECTILAWTKSRGESLSEGCAGQYYRVELEGEVGVLCASSLRRKQPPLKRGSWDAIELLTKWRPTRTTV